MMDFYTDDAVFIVKPGLAVHKKGRNEIRFY